jgi:hypothetical protein
MPFGNGELVEERLAGCVREEGVVGIAVGWNVQAVEVQVGGLLQPVAKGDARRLAFPPAQRRAGEAAVVGEKPGGLAGDLRLEWCGLKDNGP